VCQCSWLNSSGRSSPSRIRVSSLVAVSAYPLSSLATVAGKMVSSIAHAAAQDLSLLNAVVWGPGCGLGFLCVVQLPLHLASVIYCKLCPLAARICCTFSRTSVQFSSVQFSSVQFSSVQCSSALRFVHTRSTSYLTHRHTATPPPPQRHGDWAACATHPESTFCRLNIQHTAPVIVLPGARYTLQGTGLLNTQAEFTNRKLAEYARLRHASLCHARLCLLLAAKKGQQCINEYSPVC
jgi:hypothetical protein